MPDSAVSTDLLQALNRLRALAAKVALHLEVAVDEVPELRDLLVREVAHLFVRGKAELRTDAASRRRADPIDVREPDLEPLLARKIDACDSCQVPFLSLALPLLVPWIGADDQHSTVPLDHAAAVAHRFD
jgi:hypothetical protein